MIENIPELDVIDLDKEDTNNINNKEKTLGSLDKYISNTYLALHLLLLTLHTVVLMIAIMLIDQRYMWHIFMIASFTFAILLHFVHTLSKNIKKKKNKLNTHKVKFIWQLLYVMLSIVWMCVISMICGLIYAMITFKVGYWQ